MKLAIIDKIGLSYDGDTLKTRGLGGSESAVILIAKELSQTGFEVTVYNNCNDGSSSSSGIVDGVTYIDNSDAATDTSIYDVVIVSRTALPFVDNSYPFIHKAKSKILWLHDTFIEGDAIVEELVVSGKIDHIFTLSDWHTSYILNCDHGKKRNYEVLKSKIFQTRNGAVCHIPEVDLLKKDKNHFVYNASATKGMMPLVEYIWPEIKRNIPDAHLTVVGGFYRFRDGAAPDAQENTVTEYTKRQDLEDLGITFTGVITQAEIAKILANANMMLYPGAFPETFGISTLESLLYKTPLVTTRFGALEETAIDMACYLIDYAIEPNNLFPKIDKNSQINKFVQTVFDAYNNPYLHQQKQNYCDVVKDIAGWNTVALQWKQFLYKISGKFLPVDEYHKVSYINDKVSRIFGRTSEMPQRKEYRSFGIERKIVVLSPFWNAANYIKDHILSVAQQDYTNYEHILVDDASTDDSYIIAKNTIESLPDSIQNRFILKRNDKNIGAIANQFYAHSYTNMDDIIMLLDGDDFLINNNTIFHYYNALYARGYEFTYGSMWSMADNIPLIAQEYPTRVKADKSYRDHLFNWKIPYTHLRTFLSSHMWALDKNKMKVNGEWMKSGADNPLFYELIEQVDSDKIYCNKEIICNYNDLNPLNDYKIRGDEQNENANTSYTKKSETKVNKKILIGIPTNKYIEPQTMKALWDLEVPDGYELDFQYFYGYQIDQIRNLIGEWAKGYDYLLSVDSDIVLPRDALTKMLRADKDVVSGLYIQRLPNTHVLEVYMVTPNGGCTNIPGQLLSDQSLVEIAACGMGAVLIKSEVFRTLDYPHFYYKSALHHKDTVSEDVYFCLKAREEGFTIWADCTIKCDHVGSSTYKVQIPELQIQVEEPQLLTEESSMLISDVQANIEDISSQDLMPAAHVSYLKKMGIKPKVIYDIGSCVLHWERHAAEIWPKAEIFLFEANKDVEYLYAQKTSNYHLGVLSGMDHKELTFYNDPMNLGGNSYYKENTEFYTEEHATKEIGMTLDTIVKTKKWPKPDLIKIDVQGAELDILKGATATIKSCKDIILEAQHVDYNKGAPKVKQVTDYLNSIGFTLEATICKNETDGDYHFKRT